MTWFDWEPPSPKAVVVFHAYYGCDTGCCGHRIEFADGTERFAFAHPWGEDEGDLRVWAEELLASTYGRQHIADLDWDNCLITTDC